MWLNRPFGDVDRPESVDPADNSPVSTLTGREIDLCGLSIADRCRNLCGSRKDYSASVKSSRECPAILTEKRNRVLANAVAAIVGQGADCR